MAIWNRNYIISFRNSFFVSNHTFLFLILTFFHQWCTKYLYSFPSHTRICDLWAEIETIKFAIFFRSTRYRRFTKCPPGRANGGLPAGPGRQQERGGTPPVGAPEHRRERQYVVLLQNYVGNVDFQYASFVQVDFVGSVAPVFVIRRFGYRLLCLFEVFRCWYVIVNCNFIG